jgi:hypothetical protein
VETEKKKNKEKNSHTVSELGVQLSFWEKDKEAGEELSILRYSKRPARWRDGRKLELTLNFKH